MVRRLLASLLVSTTLAIGNALPAEAGWYEYTPSICDGERVWIYDWEYNSTWVWTAEYGEIEVLGRFNDIWWYHSDRECGFLDVPTGYAEWYRGPGSGPGGLTWYRAQEFLGGRIRFNNDSGIWELCQWYPQPHCWIV